MSDLKRSELIEIILNYNSHQDEFEKTITSPTTHNIEFLKEQVAMNVEAERLKTVDKMN